MAILQLAPFAGRKKYATQISPLLNLIYGFQSFGVSDGGLVGRNFSFGFWTFGIFLDSELGLVVLQKNNQVLQLYKLFNSNIMSDDWISLNVQQNFNGRNEHIQIFRKSNYNVGRNLLVNRFQSLNNKIDYSWFNDSFESSKIKCKNLLL